MLFLLLGVAAGLYITDSMLSVLDNLQNRPDWVIAVFLGVVLVVVALSAFLVMKLLFPRNKQNKKTKISENSEEVILERIKKASDSGLNTQQVEREVFELASRRKAGHIYVAMFGEVNMGKSSIICTVLP